MNIINYKLDIEGSTGEEVEPLWRSKTSTGLNHHVPVFFEDDVVVVVIEEDGDGAELGGGAARLRDLIRFQEVDLPEQRKTVGNLQWHLSYSTQRTTVCL